LTVEVQAVLVGVMKQWVAVARLLLACNLLQLFWRRAAQAAPALLFMAPSNHLLGSVTTAGL